MSVNIQLGLDTSNCLQFQVFYDAIKSVPEFDDGPIPLSPSIEVIGRGSAQSYIILFGSYKNETEPPVIKALNINMPISKSTTITRPENIIIMFSVFIFFWLYGY